MMTVNQRNPDTRSMPMACRMRSGRHCHRPAKPDSASEGATHMIGMFMCYQNGVNIIWLHAQPSEAAQSFARPEPGIDEDTGIS